MDTWSPKTVKRECGSLQSSDGVKRILDKKMCRVSSNEKTDQERNSEKNNKHECENLNTNLEKKNQMEVSKKNSQTINKGRSSTSKTRERTMKSQERRPSPLENSKRNSHSENVFRGSKNRFGASRVNEGSQYFREPHRSRSPPCSPREEASLSRGFRPTNRNSLRRRFRSTSSEFFGQNRDFVCSSIYNSAIESETQGFRSQHRRGLSPRRSFGSNDDLLYTDFDRQRSTRDDEYAVSGSFEDQKRRWISSYDQEVGGHVRNRLNRTRWTNHAEEISHFEIGRSWRIEDSTSKYSTNGLGTDYRRGMVPSADMNKLSRVKNCPRSPASCSSTSYQRYKRESDCDLSSRLPARNRLGWNTDEPNSSAFDNDGLDTFYSSVNLKERGRRFVKNRFDRFKSSVDARSGRVNAIWRRKGRGYGFHDIKRTDFKYGKEDNRGSELASNNKTSSVAEAERQSSSDPVLECVVSESLSKFRRTSEFLGPEFRDDASTIRNSEKTSTRMESRNRLEEESLFRSGYFKGAKRLKPDEEKCQEADNDHRKIPKSTSLPHGQSQTVCHVNSSEKNGAQMNVELETELSRSKYSPVDTNSIRTHTSDSKFQGYIKNDSSKYAKSGERMNSSSNFLKSAKSLVGPHTPTYDEVCTPPSESAVDLGFQPSHHKPASVEHITEGCYDAPSAECSVRATLYAAVSHSGAETQSGCNVPPICATSGESWTIMPPAGLRHVSTSHHMHAGVPYWNQSMVPVQQTNHGIMQTVFRSDWPTAADQQRFLLSNSTRDSVVPMSGSLSATTDVYAPLVTAVVPGKSQEELNPALMYQSSHSNSLHAEAFTRQITMFSNPSLAVQYSDGGVYGDSPLLDEPVYHSPHAASDSLVGSSLQVSVPQSSCFDPRSARGAGVSTRPSSMNPSTNSMLQDCGMSEGSGDILQTAHFKQDKVDRMERIADEVKAALKPFFVGGEIDKEEYKDIMRRAVPKINASKNAGIDSKRISVFIAEYVGKVKTAQKRVVADRIQVIDAGNAF